MWREINLQPTRAHLASHLLPYITQLPPPTQSHSTAFYSNSTCHFRPGFIHGINNTFDTHSCIVPLYSSQTSVCTSLSVAWAQVWIPNLDALPIIALVSLTHIPCWFARFYDSVWCVYTFFFSYLSCQCLARCVFRVPCHLHNHLFSISKYTVTSLLAYTFLLLYT